MNWDRLLRWHLDPLRDPFPFDVVEAIRRDREDAAARLDLTGVEEPPKPWDEPPGSYEWPEGTAEWPDEPEASIHPPAPRGWPGWTEAGPEPVPGQPPAEADDVPEPPPADGSS